MPGPHRPSFWEELRRRRVVRAITVYGITAWVVVQVADVFFPALRVPDWALTVVAALAIIGFPITVAIAWIFDRTAGGWERTPGETGAAVDGAAPAGASGLDLRLALAVGLGALAGVIVVGTGVWLASVLRGGGSGGGAGADVVAVLPFEAVGDANATFTAGIHGDVLTGLSGVAGLDVISRGSVLRYAGRERPAAEVAEELGAGWVLRGEVQQVGDQVRVHARLVDAASERQVWAEAFRRELTAANLFDIQQELTRQIVRALEARLSPAGSRAGGPGTEDLEAYRLYVQGRGLLGSRTEPAMRRAASFFRRALDRDPEYAAAWAGLADALVYLETFGFPLPEGSAAPRSAAVRALELDPGLAEAHFALSNLAHAERDDPEALRRARRAIELRPSYSDAYNLVSWMEKLHGRPLPSLEAAQRAVDLDPLGSAPLSNLALARLITGDPETAASLARRVQELHPEFSTGRFIEALALYHQGRYAEALPLLDGLDVAWAGAGPEATRALALLALGDTASARGILARLDPSEHPFSSALIRAALGETGAATAMLHEIERWDYWPTYAVRYFFPDALRAVRDAPRHDRLLARVSRSWGLQDGPR